MKTHNIYAAKPELVKAIQKFLPKGVEVNEHGWVTKPVHYKTFDRIRLAVARELFGQPFKDVMALKRFFDAIKERASANQNGSRWNPEYLAAVNKLNEHLLPLNGYGEDCLFIDESLPEDGMTAFTTLAEYDRMCFNSSQAGRAEYDSKYVPTEYKGTFHGEFVRWLEGGHIVYGNMSMAAWDIYAKADGACHRLMEEIYPYEVSFEVKKWGAGFVADNAVHQDLYYKGSKLAAEECMRRLRDNWVPYLRSQAPAAVVKRVEPLCEDHRKIVFLNESALEHVSIASFVRDLKALPDATSEYEVYKSQQIGDVINWFGREVMPRLADEYRASA